MRLAPGEAKTVEITLRRADLLFIARDLTAQVEAGQFLLRVAPSAQADGVAGTFTLA